MELQIESLLIGSKYKLPSGRVATLANRIPNKGQSRFEYTKLDDVMLTDAFVRKYVKAAG